MAKIQADSQMKQQALQEKAMEAQAEFQLKKQLQDQEMQLQRERAAGEIELKRQIAVAELELERMKIQESNDADIDAAIAKVQALSEKHTAMSQKSEESEDSGESQADFQGAVNQILEALNAKKSISLTRKDGQVVGAEVSIQ